MVQRDECGRSWVKVDGTKGLKVDGPKVRKWTVFSKGLFRLRVYTWLYFDWKCDSLDSSLSYSWSTFAYNLIFWTIHFQTSGPSSWPSPVWTVQLALNRPPCLKRPGWKQTIPTKADDLRTKADDLLGKSRRSYLTNKWLKSLTLISNSYP